MTDAKLTFIVCLCLLAMFAGCTERGDRAASVVADVRPRRSRANRFGSP